MVVTLIAWNANEAVMVPMVGSSEVYVWQESSPESGCQFCVGAFGRNLASVAIKMFSYLIYFQEML
jgi:hypothetical protein